MRRTLAAQRQFIALALVVAVAFAIRLDSISAPPLDFSPSRQTYGALRARIVHTKGQTEVPAWRRDVLESVRAPQIEPPVLEHVAATAYRIVGFEASWIPRLFSVVIWLAGGVFVYRLAQRLGRNPVAPLAVGLYLLWPIGIFGSRIIQPDAMMVVLTLAALLALVRYDERPSSARLGAATAVSALAVLSKPPFAAFFLLGVLTALSVGRSGYRHALTSRSSWLYVVGSLAPAAAYVVWARASGLLAGHTSSSLQPELLLEPRFWRAWSMMVANVVSFPELGLARSSVLAIVIGLASAAFLGVRAATPLGRRMLVGLWLGYATLGVTFTSHTSSHLYYSLPLVPIIALSLAPVLAFVVHRQRRAPVLVRVAALVLVALVIVGVGSRVERRLDDPRYAREAETYRRIGEVTAHTTRAVHVDRYYDTPLLYYAWIASRPLYYPGDGLAELPDLGARLREIEAESGRRDLLIVTAIDELHTRDSLAAFVEPLREVARTSEYAIFALHSE
ncbi:MAG: glycosyltransferase family 39 protein [Actinomycetota bacterium]|nr:glycosyltransferase family 39 protein [Actinomycetota bacterium]